MTLNISIHAPLAGSDLGSCGSALEVDLISIHAPLAGSDPCPPAKDTGANDFNPRSPCGERPTAPVSALDTSGFQSTLPLRGATALSQRAGGHI